MPPGQHPTGKLLMYFSLGSKQAQFLDLLVKMGVYAVPVFPDLSMSILPPAFSPECVKSLHPAAWVPVYVNSFPDCSSVRRLFPVPL